MKIVKTASGKRTLKLSKAEWQSIGEKAGWTKTAFIDFGARVKKCESVEEAVALSKGTSWSLIDPKIAEAYLPNLYFVFWGPGKRPTFALDAERKIMLDTEDNEVDLNDDGIQMWVLSNPEISNLLGLDQGDNPKEAL